MWPIILIGALRTAYALIDCYMVGSGLVSPGEPMYVDAIAPSLDDAILQAVTGTGLVAMGFGVRYWLRSKRTYRN